MAADALETAKEWYASVHAGDFDRLFSVMADDCVIEFYGPSIIPFAGSFEGKERCKVFFGHVAEDVTIERFDQEEFIADRDKVAVTGLLTMVLKATGRRYSANYCHVLTVRDGQVARFRDFQDTAQAVWASINLDTPSR